MEDKQIRNNLKALRAIEPESAWKQGLKSQLFDTEDSQETLISRGFLPFNLFFSPQQLKVAPILVPLVVVCLVLLVLFFPFSTGQGPEKTAEQVNYFVLLETKLDEISAPEDIQGLISIFEQASDTLSDATADDSKEATEQAIRITQKAQQKIQEMKDSGEETEELEIANQLFASKVAETFIKPDIEGAQKELVANLLKGYESSSLSNPQLELLNQAREYYNNGQIESALEIILQIGG